MTMAALLLLLVAALTATDASRFMLPTKRAHNHARRVLKSNKKESNDQTSQSFEELTFIGHDGPFGSCGGDCDSDYDCIWGLKCFQRDGFVPVPGCSGRGTEHVDYCYEPPSPTTEPTDAPTPDPTIDILSVSESTSGFLEKCEGDCDSSLDCMPGLVCYQRRPHLELEDFDFVPGCNGNAEGNADYCVDKKYAQSFDVLTTLNHEGRPYGRCAGACVSDDSCLPGLICFERDGFAPVPDCPGMGEENVNYCIAAPTPNPTRKPTKRPTPRPTPAPVPTVPTHIPTQEPVDSTASPTKISVDTSPPTDEPTQAPEPTEGPSTEMRPTAPPTDELTQAPAPTKGSSAPSSQMQADDTSSFSLDLSVAVEEGLLGSNIVMGRSSVSNGSSELEGILVRALEDIIENTLGYTVLRSDEVRHLMLRPVKIQEHSRGGRQLVTLQHDPDSTVATVVDMQNDGTLIEWMTFRIGYIITDFGIGDSMADSGNRRVQADTKASGADISSAVRDLVSAKIDDGTLLIKLQDYDGRIVGVADVGEEDGFITSPGDGTSIESLTEGESQPTVTTSAGLQTFSYALIALAVCGVVLTAAFVMRWRGQRRRARTETSFLQQKQVLSVSHIRDIHTYEEESEDDGSPRWGDGSTLEELADGIQSQSREIVLVEQESQLSTDSFGDESPAELPYDSTLYRRYPGLFYPDADNDTIDF